MMKFYFHREGQAALNEAVRLIAEKYEIEPLVRLCDQCGVLLGVKDAEGAGLGVYLTHGKCKDCMNKYRERR